MLKPASPATHGSSTPHAPAQALRVVEGNLAAAMSTEDGRSMAFFWGGLGCVAVAAPQGAGAVLGHAPPTAHCVAGFGPHLWQRPLCALPTGPSTSGPGVAIAALPPLIHGRSFPGSCSCGVRGRHERRVWVLRPWRRRRLVWHGRWPMRHAGVIGRRHAVAAVRAAQACPTRAEVPLAVDLVAPPAADSRSSARASPMLAHPLTRCDGEPR